MAKNIIILSLTQIVGHPEKRMIMNIEETAVKVCLQF